MANITINEVRRRLREFAKEHKDDSDERQHEQQFWRDFYSCFGISKSSAIMFQARVIKVGGARGFIDSFIPSVLLVEQKSRGKDLEAAYQQAQDYFYAIKEQSERPQYIITCDFETFHLYDLNVDAKTPFVCTIKELADNAGRFMFLVDDKRVSAVIEEMPINRKAADQVSRLHDALLKNNYIGRDLEVFLTRLIFCFFADDTGIFGEDGQFRKLMDKTREDGSDVGTTLALLFQVLDTPKEERQTNLDEALQAFEYVNGSLFEEIIKTPAFDFDLRGILYKCASIDWSGISPAIFGAMFQSVLEMGATDNAARTDNRRELGAHYTSERNILKVIQPLFLDELRDEFEKSRLSKTKLQALYDRLPTLKFLDPACGCGNFLVIAYREMRRLENDVINELFFKGEQGGLLDISTLCRVRVDQFFGLEIDEAAAHIARVAMYITDHQLNLESANKFGKTRATVPLVSTPHIHCANALTTDWNSVLPAEQCSYVMGNPPFLGYKYQTKEQKADLEKVYNNAAGTGVLDFVCAWYILAARYIQLNPSVQVAFVSTNSISQGEQPAVLWSELLKLGMHINFAHRSFDWRNEGRGVAAVQCVIIGFGIIDKKDKTLFYYETPSSDEVPSKVAHINPYLVDAPTVLLDKKREPISRVPEIIYGNEPREGGFLILSEEQYEELVDANDPALKFVRRFVSADDYLNDIKRYCFWLVGAEAEEMRKSRYLMQRIEQVREFRKTSLQKAANAASATPSIFVSVRQTPDPYLLIPIVSSEKRDYVPMGYLGSDVICSNASFMLPNASLYHFSVLNSSMHNSWMRAVCGRLESRYRYSNTIVYNNFAWPSDLTDESKEELEKTGQAILDARALHPNSSLASLYDPLTMPLELVKAHQANNKAVDKAYGYTGGDDDASRVAYLFKLYSKATSLLPVAAARRPRVRRADPGTLI